RGRGGTGRRAGFKIQCPKGRASSTLAARITLRIRKSHPKTEGVFLLPECTYGTTEHRGSLHAVNDKLKEGESFACEKHLTVQNILRRMKGEPPLTRKA